MTNSNKNRFSASLDVWLQNLSKTGRSRKQAVSVAVDTSLVLFSLWAAYSLRHGMLFSDFRSTWHFFLILPVITVLIYMSLGIYRWVVRSSNIGLFKQLIKAVVLSGLALVLISFLFPADRVMPRSLFVIYGLLLCAGSCGVRFLWQGIFDSGSRGEPVAIYGAGEAGRKLLHSLAQGREYRVVLFIDDDPSLDGTTSAGVPITNLFALGESDILAGLEVEKIILAMPRVGATEYQDKIHSLESFGLPVLTIPSHAELVSGKATFEQVRDISISDILGRNEVPPNVELLGKCVRGKNVLVTGGGGSIGSELSRQIIQQRPSKLVVFDHSEFNLYKITEEMNLLVDSVQNCTIEFLPVLGSVNDASQVQRLIKQEKFHTIYHAAAYKHVPVVEAQPEQGLQTNVFGTRNVVEAAIAEKVENFVLISTDKAVRPTNSMGATKRIAELVLQSKASTRPFTKISMVRFGNVLGSSGSVVPKFKAQIEHGGPITLTDPNVTRYFMTIPEAAQLVMQASAIAKGGDVFVLDMGEPVRIEELAISMVRLSGKKLKRDTGHDGDIEIEIEGLRPGEKMYEELFLDDSHEVTVVPKVFTANEEWLSTDKLNEELYALLKLCTESDRVALRKKLLSVAFLQLEQGCELVV